MRTKKKLLLQKLLENNERRQFAPYLKKCGTFYTALDVIKPF